MNTLHFIMSMISTGGTRGSGPIQFTRITDVRREIDDMIKSAIEYSPDAVTTIVIQVTQEKKA